MFICMCLGITAKYLDQKGQNLACALQEPGEQFYTCGHGNGCGFAIITPT